MTISQQLTLATISEPEIQMIIQSLIDDTGSVDAAEKWINRKLSQVHYDINNEGLNEDLIQSRDEWTLIQKYFSKYKRQIIASQMTESKFWPY